MKILKEFTTIYRKTGKHRKKCSVCGRLINDGDRIVARLIQQEKYYPVKGIMKFSTWKFMHENEEEPKGEGQ